MKGILAVISNYGVGKTTFAIGNGHHPKDMIFVNDDIKTPPFIDDFKQYIDLTGVTSGLKVLEFHAACLDMINNLPEAKVLIWDTWTRFQSSFPIYVRSNPNEFRKPQDYSAMGKIKSAEQYNDAYAYEGQILTKLREKFELIILTFHIKQHYENNVAIPGKYQPGHDRAIQRYADFRLWLTHSQGQTPNGLVLKNVGKYTITSNGVETVQVFPLKIPACDWKKLREYWENPIGDRTPLPEEKPDEFEISMIDGTLTPEEKRLYQASIQYAERIAKEEDNEAQMAEIEGLNVVKSRALEMSQSGMTIPMIVKQLQADSPETTISQVAQWINGA